MDGISKPERLIIGTTAQFSPSLIESLPVAAVITEGLEQRFVYVNRRLRQLTGYTPADVPDIDSWWRIAYPDPVYREVVREQWESRLARAMARGDAMEPMEVDVTCSDGRQRRLQFHATPLGERTLIVCSDVSELRRTEAALQERERHLSSLIASMQDLLLVMDDEGRYTDCHVPDAGDLRASPEEFIGAHFSEFLPEDVSRQVSEALEQVRRTGEPYRFRYGLEVGNGSKHFQATISSLDPAAPSRAGFLTVIQDITDQVRVEQELRQSEQRFRDIVDTAHGIVWEADAETFRFTFVSRQAESMLGYSVEEWKQPGFWINHLHSEDAGWAPAYCQRCCGALEAHEFEYRFIARDGEVHWLRDFVTVVAEEGRPRWLRGIMVDITEQKCAEEFLALQQRLQGLVARISMQLIDTGDIAFDDTINRALRQMGEFFAVDRSYIFLYSDDAAYISCTHEWCAPGVEPQIERTRNLPSASFEWWHRQMQARLPVYIPRVADLPEEAAAEREELTAQGIHSLVALPLVSRDRVIGFMGLDIVRSGMEMPEHHCTLLRVVAGAIASAIERNEAEQKLRIAATAFEAQEGMFVMDADNVILTVNRAFAAMTGYEPDEVVGRSHRILRSDRHSGDFYQAVWDQILWDGNWQGEVWLRRKSGEEYLAWVTMTAVHGSDRNFTHYVGTMNDITQRKAAEEEIEYLAYYDGLTQLPNRSLLLDRIRKALARSERQRRGGALLFIDLDNFKLLNDTLGHPAGDLFLQHVARRLRGCIRGGDTLARLGGDEFVVMVEDLSPSREQAVVEARGVAEKILLTLSQPYVLAGREQHATCSIGVAMFEDPEITIEELMKRADLAMYQAKSEGRDTIRFFDPVLQATIMERAALEADMRLALREDGFLLHYQPKVDADGRLTGAEALLRWQNPRRGAVSPNEFVPLAEEVGLIIPLGRWVLEQACRQLARWRGDPATKTLDLSINISARQFDQPGFVEQVLSVLEATGADPRRLVLEITESLFLGDLEDTVEKMSLLKARGVGFSLDDFGTGYSSLIYLKRLPLDQLKIDHSFVRDALEDPNDAAIIRTILSLGRSLELEVIAEGVETTAQRDWLAGLGCRAYQGYLFGRPGPVEDLPVPR